MKTGDKVILNAEGLKHYCTPRSTQDWPGREGVIVYLSKDGHRTAVVWDGNVRETMVLIEHLRVL